MPRSSRAVAAAGWILAALSLTAFAILRGTGALGPARTPVWDPHRFAALSGGDSSGRASSASLWLVAVNPGCPHCLAALADLAARQRAQHPPHRLAALLVDVRERPNADSLALPVQAVWWDSAEVWRREWHRHAYGEVMMFDSSGTLEGVRAPERP